MSEAITDVDLVSRILSLTQANQMKWQNHGGELDCWSKYDHYSVALGWRWSNTFLGVRKVYQIMVWDESDPIAMHTQPRVVDAPRRELTKLAKLVAGIAAPVKDTVIAADAFSIGV